MQKAVGSIPAAPTTRLRLPARILGFQSEEAGAAPAGGTNCLHQRIWRLGYEPGTGSSSLPGGSISSAHPLRRRSPSKRPRAGLIPAWASGPVVQWTASENPNLWIQVQLLAGSPIRAADVTGNRTGLKSRVSGFESRAAHYGGIAQWQSSRLLTGRPRVRFPVPLPIWPASYSGNTPRS